MPHDDINSASGRMQALTSCSVTVLSLLCQYSVTVLSLLSMFCQYILSHYSMVTSRLVSLAVRACPAVSLASLRWVSWGVHLHTTSSSSPVDSCMQGRRGEGEGKGGGWMGGKGMGREKGTVKWSIVYQFMCAIQTCTYVSVHVIVHMSCRIVGDYIVACISPYLSMFCAITR